MMRGVSNWAVAVRKPSAEQLRRGRALARGGRAGRDRGHDLPAGLRDEAATACCGCRSSAGSSRWAARWRSDFARSRSRPTRSCRPSRARSQERSRRTRLREIPRWVWAGTVVVAVVLAIVLFFLIPVGLTSLIKDQLGSSVLFWLVEGLIRTEPVPRLHAAALARARPAARVRVPRRRAQDDLLLRGRTAS